MPERSSCINFSLEENQEGLKTTLGNHIKRLLGLDDDLVKYDDLCFKLKAATKAGNGVHMTTSISEYNKLGAKFKTKIKLVRSERANKLKELTYFAEYGKLPAKTKGSQYYNIVKDGDVATVILRTI